MSIRLVGKNVLQNDNIQYPERNTHLAHTVYTVETIAMPIYWRHSMAQFYLNDLLLVTTFVYINIRSNGTY